MTNLPVAAPQSLLYVKLSALGDQIFSFPAIEDALRRHPALAIDWVVDERFANIVQLHPRVRRVFALPLRRWRRHGWWNSRHEIAQFWRALRAQRYDLVIDAQGMWKSALVTWFARKDVAVGYSAAYCGESAAARFYDHHLDMPDVHGSLRLRATFAQAIGSDASGAPVYGLPPRSRVDFVDDDAYAVLLHGASKDEKLWAEPHWVEVACALHARGLRSFLPWGNDAERARALRLAEAINALAQSAATVAPSMSLPECADFIGHADVVVGLDTGLLHLALAYERPTVGLFVATRTDYFYPVDASRGVALGGAGAEIAVADVIAAIDAVRK